MTEVLEAAPFHHAHHAAAWAYATVSGAIIKVSSIGRWGTKGRRGRDIFAGLSPHERHAQAAQVILHIDRLEGVYLHWVRAEFLPVPVKRKEGEPKLVEMGYTVVWNYAIDRLTENVVSGLGTGVHRRRPYQLVVEEYFGARVGARWIRREMKCAMTEALGHRKTARERLDKLGQTAMDMLANSLEQAGLVERDPYA